MVNKLRKWIDPELGFPFANLLLGREFGFDVMDASTYPNDAEPVDVAEWYRYDGDVATATLSPCLIPEPTTRDELVGRVQEAVSRLQKEP